MLVGYVQVVRFAPGSLDLGYLYDDVVGPHTKTRRTTRPARWVVDNDGHVTQEEEAEPADEPLEQEQGTQTDNASVAVEQVEIGVQTESASSPSSPPGGRAFSALRKDLPQFSRPAKHTVK